MREDEAAFSAFVILWHFGVLHAAKSLFRHGVIATAAKRIATQNAQTAQNNGGKHVAFTKRRECIFRARGGEAAGIGEKR